MNITVTQLYQSLSKKIGSDTAEELTNFITQDVSDKLEQKVSSLASKEDLALTRKEIAEAKVDMIKWFVGLFIILALMIIGLYFK
jgi:hypothetical protein